MAAGVGKTFRMLIDGHVELEAGRDVVIRIIVSADEDQHSGLGYDDLRWLLERVPAEILILRPAPEDTRRISANGSTPALTGRGEIPSPRGARST